MKLIDRIRRLVRAPDKPDYAALRNAGLTACVDWQLGNSEAIYAAVSRIATTIARLPLHLYKDFQVAADDRREKLISYVPNACMTPYMFKLCMEAFRNTAGNAYALKVYDPDTGELARLDVLDASRVQPQRELTTGEIWYSFTLDDGQMAMVHSSEMIVLKHLCANGEKGISPIDVLRGTLDYSRKIREFSLEQLSGVSNGVVLTLPGTALNGDKQNASVQRFVESYKKSGGGVMVLEGGMQVSTLARSVVDANVLSTERITQNRVATVYSIPPHMLGDYSDTTYSTAEQSQQEFLDMTILPVVTQWQEELNLKLLTWREREEGYEFRFDLSRMKNADTAAMAEKHQKAIRGGWMTPNEVRRSEGLPPVDGGDALLASRDLTTLNMAMEGEDNGVQRG